MDDILSYVFTVSIGFGVFLGIFLSIYVAFFWNEIQKSKQRKAK